MSNTTQLLKGLMEGVILKIIDEEETYGYEIYTKLMNAGFSEFSEGSLYPLLLRLEKNTLIKFIKKPSNLGPERKYYSLTELGEETLLEFKEAWFEIAKKVDALWK